MPLDIILFAAIAIFFVWKLRQVLGNYNDEDRNGAPRANPFEPKPDEPRSAHDTGPANVKPAVVINGEAREVQPAAAPAFTHPANSLAGGLAQIHILDSNFDEKNFVVGARQAYSLIVEAFAKADKATLKTLLKPEIYAAFESEIDARTERGEVLTAEVRKISLAEISAARSDGKLAVVTVDFTSEQISLTKHSQGEIIDGDEMRPVEVSEAWTFERDTRSDSPNWQLVGTRLR